VPVAVVAAVLVAAVAAVPVEIVAAVLVEVVTAGLGLCPPRQEQQFPGRVEVAGFEA
jgi:hypothetical protein